MSSLLKRLTSPRKAALPTSPRSPRGSGKENAQFKRVKHKDVLRWSVDEVAVWLESRGLGQYAETFKRSKVNGESLVGLSEAQVRDELQLGGNDLHLRSMMAARNALLGEQKGKLAVYKWSVEDVSIWLESHEIYTLREKFKESAVHGAFLMELTRKDLARVDVDSPLMRTKVTLLIQQLAQGVISREREPVPKCWSVAEVGAWLDDVGLSRYKDIFEANSMDGLMLAHLDELMLEQLAITNKLHRRSAALGLIQLLNGAARRGSAKKRSKRERVEAWNAAQVAQWLSSNDFDDRHLAFRTNGVHGALLVKLSDSDLSGYLDMQNSIERARLLRDIRHLCGEPIDVVPGASPATAAAASQRGGMVQRAKTANAAAQASERRASGEKRKLMQVESVTSDESAPTLPRAAANDKVSRYSEDEYESDAGDDDESSDLPHVSLDTPHGSAVQRRPSPAKAAAASTSAAAADTPTKRHKRAQAYFAKLIRAPSLPKPPAYRTEQRKRKAEIERQRIAAAEQREREAERAKKQHQQQPPPPTKQPPPPRNEPPASDSKACNVCRVRSADCELGPCGHRSTCLRCAELLDCCPRCNTLIDDILDLDA